MNVKFKQVYDLFNESFGNSFSVQLEEEESSLKLTLLQLSQSSSFVKEEIYSKVKQICDFEDLPLVKIYVRSESKDLLWIDKVLPKTLDTKSTQQYRTTARQIEEATAIDNNRLDATSKQLTVGRQVRNLKALNEQIDIYLLSVTFGFFGCEFYMIHVLSEISMGLSFFDLFMMFMVFTYFNTTIYGFINIIMRLSKEWLKTFPQVRE